MIEQCVEEKSLTSKRTYKRSATHGDPNSGPARRMIYTVMGFLRILIFEMENARIQFNPLNLHAAINHVRLLRTKEKTHRKISQPYRVSIKLNDSINPTLNAKRDSVCQSVNLIEMG